MDDAGEFGNVRTREGGQKLEEISQLPATAPAVVGWCSSQRKVGYASNNTRSRSEQQVAFQLDVGRNQAVGCIGASKVQKGTK
jgi:hypothetical protein